MNIKIKPLYIIIIAVIILIVLIMMYAVAQTLPGRNSAASQKVNLDATPPGSIQLKESNDHMPSVITVYPLPNGINVPVDTEIRAILSSPLADSDKKMVHVDATPFIPMVFTFLPDNKTIVMRPTSPFQPGTKYILALAEGTHLYQWSFTTYPTLRTSEPHVQMEQAAADKEFSRWERDIDTAYPWLNQLPLQTSTYFVYFDVDTKKFNAQIYANQSAVPAIRDEITSRLKALGIPDNKYIIEWNIQAP